MSKHNDRKIGSIHLTEKALQKLQEEREQAIQHHLNEGSKALAIKSAAFNSVLVAAIHHGGLPASSGEVDAFLLKVEALASQVAARELRAKAHMVKDVLRELNVGQVPPAITYGARLAGVELFDEPEQEAKAEAPPSLIVAPS